MTLPQEAPRLVHPVKTLRVFAAKASTSYPVYGRYVEVRSSHALAVQQPRSDTRVLTVPLIFVNTVIIIYELMLG